MPQCPYNLTSIRNSSLLHNWVLTHSYQTLQKNTNMVLRTGHETEEWESYFIKVGISANSAKSYPATFAREKLMKENFQMIDPKKSWKSQQWEKLCLSLKKLRSPLPRPSTLRHHLPSFPYSTLKWPPPPTIQKILNQWQVFTRMTDMPILQTSIQLYSCANESVQNTIINTYPEFFTIDPDKLQEMIEVLVPQKSNPIVHRITFTSMSQHHKDEPI